MKKLHLLLLVPVLFNIACTQHILEFSIVSTKPISFTQAGDFQKRYPQVKGTDKIYYILVFPTGDRPTLTRAINKAIESVPGCVALMDGEASRTQWYISYIYGEYYFTVEGTPLINPNWVANDPNQIGKYSLLKVNKKGDIIEARGITVDEYQRIKGKIISEK
jgi:hypothetical protein